MTVVNFAGEKECLTHWHASLFTLGLRGSVLVAGLWAVGDLDVWSEVIAVSMSL